MLNLINNLPKSELHVHVRGAMPVEVFTDLLNKYPASEALRGFPARYYEGFAAHANIRPFLTPKSSQWTAEETAPLFRTEKFEQFLDTFNFTGFFLRDISDMRRLTLGVVEKLRAQHIVYAEITISVKEYLRHEITLEDVVVCLDEAARVPGIRVQWIVDLVRDFGLDLGLELLGKLLALKCESLVGITLGGSEHKFPPEQFVPLYNLARDNGLRLTVHAGEVLGPQSVWNALNLLGVERIGHGVRAIEDPALVAYLAEHGIPLEVCPTSNLCTGVYKSYQEHPVKRLFAAGVPITINSDDPTFFDTTLANEYVQVYNIGVEEAGVYEMLQNSFKYAFLPERDKQAYLSQLEREWRRLHNENGRA